MRIQRFWSRIGRADDNSNQEKSEERGSEAQHGEILVEGRREEREDWNTERWLILERPIIFIWREVIKIGAELSDVG